MPRTSTISAGLLTLAGALLLTACSEPAPTVTTTQPTPDYLAPQAFAQVPLAPRLRPTPAHVAPIPADTSATGLAGALADVRRRSYFLASSPQAPTTRAAHNTAQHLTAQLGATSYTIAAAVASLPPHKLGQPVVQQLSSKPAWQVRFALRGIGRNGQISFQPQDSSPSTDTDTTVAYQHGSAFSVDYVNSPAGVRQNYHLAQRPGGTTGSVQVLLTIDTKLRVQEESDQALRFATAEGPVLRYSGLKAWDAMGRTLPAHLALQERGHALALVVDDAQATYPITIDPLASTPSTTLSEPNGFNFGESVAGAGDVNGDGYADVIIGAAGSYLSKGAAFLYLGSSTGLSSTAAATLTDPTATFFGSSVAGAGDVNGDGYADVVIGALYANNYQGRAYVYLGSRTGLSPAPSTTFTNPTAAPDNYFGISVASAGDVNGDGYSDVVIGASGTNNNTGRAYVYLGGSTGSPSSPSLTLNEPTGGSTAFFGYSVASAGDVNGDGYADVIIGSVGFNGGRGQALLYLGRSTGLAQTPSATFNDPTSPGGNQFGYNVASAGDVNGDGYADVVIGALSPTTPISSYRPSIYLYLGNSTGLDATPSTKLTIGGYRAAGAGDVNGDGYADVLAQAGGSAHLYLGSSTGLSATANTILNNPTSTPNDFFGTSVAGAGDVNGDGYADVLVGAYGTNNGPTNSKGKAYVYLGSPGATLASPSTTFTNSNSVASAGDTNGDGYTDVLISSAGNRVYLYLGSSTGLSTTPSLTLNKPTQNTNDYFGGKVAGAGDVNGDGYTDVLVTTSANLNTSGGTGGVYLYLGSSTGLSTMPAATLRNPSGGNNFTRSLGGAGDVNGDGYADVIIGGEASSSNFRGRAYLYLGSSAGLGSTPSLIFTDPAGTALNRRFGLSVSGAGDTNGDGYADILIGDPGNNFSRGLTYVYLGGSTGPGNTPSLVLDDPSSANASYFGEQLTGAGDVNGDGYTDALIGGYFFNNGQGRAYVFLGSRSGLSSTPSTTLSDPGGTNFDYFSIGLGAAGDVNGDGYSDLLVGSDAYVNTTPDRAYLYLGSPVGISATPSTTLTDPIAVPNVSNFYARTLTGVGDVNGDGYSDVFVNSDSNSKAYLYLGNEGGGRVGRLRLYNPDLATPLSQSTVSGNQFGIGLIARSAFGRVWARVVWEAVGNGSPFSGTPITNSVAASGRGPWTNLPAGALTELKSLVTKAGRTTRVRARLEYATASLLSPNAVSSSTGGVGALPRYGPWTYVDAQQLGQSTNGATPLPVQSTLATPKQLQAYPNPFSQQLTVRLEVEQAGPATLRLTDALGRVVAQRALVLARGTSTLTFDEANQISPGLYLLQLQQGSSHQTITVVRQ